MPDSNLPRSSKIPASALPRSEEGCLDWLRLIRSRRVGPATFIRLIRQFGSARGALDALPAIAAESGVRDYAPASRSEVEAEWRAAEAAGAAPLLLGGPGYPALLATIADPPPFLWAMGSEALCGQRSVALVGARNASALGCRMAARLATDLGGMGFAVVSGLARGIDAAAHRAALPTGTIAVQAGGVDVVYPAENGGLAASIAESGLRLSEMPIGHAPRPQDFPRRNRIVSGLAEGIVVVEGALRSGSLITDRNALLLQTPSSLKARFGIDVRVDSEVISIDRAAIGEGRGPGGLDGDRLALDGGDHEARRLAAGLAHGRQRVGPDLRRRQLGGVHAGARAERERGREPKAQACSSDHGLRTTPTSRLWSISELASFRVGSAGP